MGLQNKEILIIDDDPDFRILLKRILENRHMVVQEAQNIHQGLNILKDRAPHLITLDMKLADEQGIDFLKIKNKNPKLTNIPVIMISSYAQKDLISQSIDLMKGLGRQDIFRLGHHENDLFGPERLLKGFIRGILFEILDGQIVDGGLKMELWKLRGEKEGDNCDGNNDLKGMLNDKPKPQFGTEGLWHVRHGPPKSTIV